MPDYCGPYQTRFVQTVNGPQPITAFPVPSACNNLFTRSAEERGRHFSDGQPGAQTQNSRRVKNALRGLGRKFLRIDTLDGTLSRPDPYGWLILSLWLRSLRTVVAVQKLLGIQRNIYLSGEKNLDFKVKQSVLRCLLYLRQTKFVPRPRKMQNSGSGEYLIVTQRKFKVKLAYFHWNFRNIGSERELCVIYAQTTSYYVELPLPRYRI